MLATETYTQAKINSLFLITAILFQIAVIVVMTVFPTDLNSIYLVIPAIAIVVLLLFNVKLSIYILIATFFLNIFIFENSGLKIADVMLILLICSYFLYGLITGSIRLCKTQLDTAIIAFLSVLGLSLFKVADISLGVKSFLRHVELFLLFYIIVSLLQKSEIKNFLTFYLVVVLINSLISITQFLQSGGRDRTFGLAGIPFADLLIPAIVIAYVHIIFQNAGYKRRLLTISLFILMTALYATGTRGAFLSLVLTFLVINFYLFKSRFLRSIRRVFKRSLSLMLIGAVTIAISLQISGKPVYRSHGFQSAYQGGVETIELRLILWNTAWQAFWENPTLGIGIGQFTKIESVFPSFKKNPLYQFLGGSDPHLILLSYLSAAGLLGLIALLYFYFRIIKTAWINYKHSLSDDGLKISLTLLSIMSFVVISSFYAGAWFWSVNGMEFMLFLGLSVVQSKQTI